MLCETLDAPSRPPSSQPMIFYQNSRICGFVGTRNRTRMMGGADGGGIYGGAVLQCGCLQSTSIKASVDCISLISVSAPRWRCSFVRERCTYALSLLTRLIEFYTSAFRVLSTRYQPRHIGMAAR